jgi:small subunit ribosomal protein S6
MRRYETIVITDPDLSAEQREPVLQRVSDVVEQGDGYLALTDEWGARKLAYEVKKKDRGYYIRFDYCGNGAVVNEIERFFRIDDRILKYMTVLVDKTADIEKIKEEIAAAQIKSEKDKEQTEAAAAATPPEAPVEAQAEAAKTETPAEEPAEAQAKAGETETPPEKPAETHAEAAKTETPAEEPAEAQTEAGETESPTEEPAEAHAEAAETEEALTSESEAGESEAAPTETEEEKK